KSDGQQQQARLAPVTSHPLRDFDEAKLWEPKVRYVVADDIALLEREDFKRMRPTSSMPAPLQTSVMPYFPVRSAAMFPSQYAAYPQGSGKPNRPPKPVNTFLIFCRLLLFYKYKNTKRTICVVGRQWRKKLMAQNPNASAKEASRLLGEMWQKLTEEQRAR
ncbi:hypothetical protein AaE_006816, partial [Aphanomyces astaci]